MLTNSLTFAREKASLGNRGRSGCFSSRYSRIAIEPDKFLLPSVIVGSLAFGFRSRYFFRVLFILQKVNWF